MSINNVDDILIPREQSIIDNGQAPVQSVDAAVGAIDSPAEPQENAPVSQPEVAENEPVVEQAASVEPEAVETVPEVNESPIDEYGNPVEKPRMYTEDEVNRLIRDRLSRGKFAEQSMQQQTQQAAKDFTPDPNSEETWEKQLDAYIDRRLETREKELNQKQWQEQERAKQSDFETKFTQGMSKYQDFHQVVSGKPITNDMMLATRSLENPAAFIYGASKLHPQELSRISQITDPYVQAAEVGRLHERMVKARNAVSKAAKPVEAVKGDVPISRTSDRPSIDRLIEQHGRQKQQIRRR